MNNRLVIFALSLFASAMIGCNINSNLMLKTPKDFVFDEIPSDTVLTSYTISPNDIIQFRLFANEGYRIIDLSAGTEANGRTFINRNNMLDFLVDQNGAVRLPILDTVYLAGLTVREAEFHLQTLYDSFYVDPYIQVEVLNRRAIVFPGSGADAQVVPLANRNTTLMEVLASVGGIPDRGRAKRIKIMRKMGETGREVYMVDLSTIDGLKHADMIIQANDYIYVEPAPNISQELLSEIAPIVSIISSAVLVVTAIRLFRQ